MVDKKKAIRITVISIWILLSLFAIIYITNPPKVKEVILSYMILLVVVLLGFTISKFKRFMIPVNFKGLFSFKKETAGRAVLVGLFATGIFFLLTNFFPSLSIGLPQLPATISETLRTFIILFIAPVVEELFFASFLFGFLISTKFGRKNILITILIVSILFSLTHLSAYILGIYDYPDLPTALGVFGQNIGAFMAAFIFRLSTFFLVFGIRLKDITPEKINKTNLLRLIIFHFGINFIILKPLVVIF